jgi:hypothetical protein
MTHGIDNYKWLNIEPSPPATTIQTSLAATT